MKNKDRKKLIAQPKKIKLEDFLYLYYQLNLDSISLELDTKKQMMECIEFEKFIQDSNISSKSHQSFLIYCMNLKKWLENKDNPTYCNYIRYLTEASEEEYLNLCKKDKQLEENISLLKEELHRLNHRKKSWRKLYKNIHTLINNYKGQLPEDKSYCGLLDYFISSEPELLKGVEMGQEKNLEEIGKKQ